MSYIEKEQTEILKDTGVNVTGANLNTLVDGIASDADALHTHPSKEDTITGAATTITSSDLTADRVVISDGSGKVAVSTVNTTTLGYLDATSSIQDQLDAKGDTITGAASTIVSLDLNPDLVVITDGSGKIAESTVSTTTLGYLDATSSIQTQLDDKVEKTTTAQIAKSGQQTVLQATINGDDGTGTKVYTMEIAEDAMIIRVFFEVVQVDGSADNTASVIINDADDILTPVATLLADKSINTVTQMHMYTLSDTDTTIYRTSTTNKYIIVLVKDTNDNGDATGDFIFRLKVEYITEV